MEEFSQRPFLLVSHLELLNFHASLWSYKGRSELDCVVRWQEVCRLTPTSTLARSRKCTFQLPPLTTNAGCHYLCSVSGRLNRPSSSQGWEYVSWLLCDCHPDRQFFTFVFLLFCGTEELCGHTEWHQEVLWEIQYEKYEKTQLNHCTELILGFTTLL